MSYKYMQATLSIETNTDDERLIDDCFKDVWWRSESLVCLLGFFASLDIITVNWARISLG